MVDPVGFTYFLKFPFNKFFRVVMYEFVGFAISFDILLQGVTSLSSRFCRVDEDKAGVKVQKQGKDILVSGFVAFVHNSPI